jgi:hypothetical protein
MSVDDHPERSAIQQRRPAGQHLVRNLVCVHPEQRPSRAAVAHLGQCDPDHIHAA